MKCLSLPRTECIACSVIALDWTGLGWARLDLMGSFCVSTQNPVRNSNGRQGVKRAALRQSSRAFW